MSLRARLGIGAALLVVVAIALQVLSVNLSMNGITGPDSTPPSYIVPTVLTMLASFCTSCAAMLVLGLVALVVIDARGLRLVAAAAPGATGHDDGIPPYGSDPERL